MEREEAAVVMVAAAAEDERGSEGRAAARGSEETGGYDRRTARRVINNRAAAPARSPRPLPPPLSRSLSLFFLCLLPARSLVFPSLPSLSLSLPFLEIVSAGASAS